MIKRRATLFILSFVCLVLISTWLFAARIASLLIPPLLSGKGIQIESLQIASVGFRSIEITQLSGQNRLTTGIVTYDMENASVTYDFFRMLPKHVEIERAVVDYHLEPSKNLTSTGESGGIALPSALDGSINQLRFAFDGIRELSARLDISISGRSGRIAFSDVVTPTTAGLSANTFTLTFTLTDDSPLAIDGQIGATGIRREGWHELPGANLDGEWTWNDGAFESNGTTSWGGSTTASWSVLRHMNGQIQVDVQAALVELFEGLKNNPDVFPIGFELSEGNIEGSFNSIRSTDRNDNQLEFIATGVDGQIGGLKFFDGSFQFHSTDLPTPAFEFEISDPTIKLANGVDVRDFHLSGRWQDGLHLDHTEMSVLGGIVNIDPMAFDINSTTHEIVLQVEDIDLEQILLMVGQEGLSGTGKLSGSIPIHHLDSAVAIDEGRLVNTTKGHISYKIDAEASSRQSEIAIQALQGFHYDVLDATLTYQVNGDYTILVRLEGRNPELYDGFPVAFNVDLSGSLPELIQASLVSRDFHTEILRYVQSNKWNQ